MLARLADRFRGGGESSLQLAGASAHVNFRGPSWARLSDASREAHRTVAERTAPADHSQTSLGQVTGPTIRRGVMTTSASNV